MSGKANPPPSEISSGECALEASDRLLELDSQHTSEGLALIVNDDGVSEKSIDVFVCERKGVGGIASKRDAHATLQERKGPIDLMLRVVSLWVGDSNKSVVGNIECDQPTATKQQPTAQRTPAHSGSDAPKDPTGLGRAFASTAVDSEAA
ncbi:hypothetical protein BC826DRAFT_1105977 [Russula brevipes]|nr:hypothetical protein BC826DRAFT_1105977 [Russula brevipes]